MKRGGAILLGIILLSLGHQARAQDLAPGADAALPRHPIPYRVLERQARRKTAVKASPTATSERTAPIKPTAPTPPGAPPPAPQPHPSAPRPPPLAPARAPSPLPTPAPTASLAVPPPARPSPPPAEPRSPAAAPAPIALAPSPIGLPAGDVGAFVDGLVASAWAEEHLAGVTAAIVQDGRPLLLKGWGRAGPGRPMDPTRTRVRLGRTSEVFPFLLVAQAVASGRLHVEDAVNARLPPDLQIPDEGFQKPIVLSDLLAHSAGFEDRLFGRLYVEDAQRLTPFESALTRLRPRRVRAPRRLAVPSAYGVAVAAEIVSRLKGKPFQSLIETDVIRPLGLARTTFSEPYPASEGLPPPLDEAKTQELAVNYVWTRRGLEAQPYAFGQSLAPASAGTTTAVDMARLMTALLDHGVLDGRQAIDRRSADLLTTPLWTGLGGAQKASYGLVQSTLDNGVEIFQSQAQGPGFTATLALAPRLRLGVFIATNSDGGSRLGRRLTPAILSRFTPQAPAPPTQASEGAVDGVFLPADRAYHGLEAMIDRLTLPLTAAGRRDGAGLIISDHGVSRPYRRVGDARFRADDGQDLLIVDDGLGPFALVFGAGGGAAERLDALRSRKTLFAAVALAAAVVLSSLGGLIARARVEPRETPHQAFAGAAQIVACLLWTGAMAAFAAFASRGLGRSRLMYEWPDDSLILASWLALAAAIVTLALVVQLPAVWREGRRVAGWTTFRKLRHSIGLAAFVFFAVVLAAWGALEPWSS